MHAGSIASVLSQLSAYMNGWSPLLPFLGLVNAFYTAQEVNNQESGILAKLPVL